MVGGRFRKSGVEEHIRNHSAAEHSTAQHSTAQLSGMTRSDAQLSGMTRSDTSETSDRNVTNERSDCSDPIEGSDEK